MKTGIFLSFSLFVLGVAGLQEPAQAQQDSTTQDVAGSWDRFRGPNGQGVVKSNDRIPSEWGKKKNIQWSADIIGLGSSSPIVVGDRIFLTSYTGFGLDKKKPGESTNLKRHLICIDKSTGKQLWERSVSATSKDDPYKGFITEHGYASCSPTSDGKTVYVNFGRAGLFAFSVNGDLLWKQTLGNQSDPRKWGLGASPVLVNGVLIVNCGNLDRSIKAFDPKSGNQKWIVKNEKFANSWSTPITVKDEKGNQVVVNMPETIFAFDPASGKILWKTPSPVTGTACASLAKHGSVIYTMGGRAGKAGAIDCCKSDTDEEGNEVRKSVWNGNLRAGIGTPIVVGDYLLWHSRGLLYRANREDGELVDTIRLPKKKQEAAPGAKPQRPKASYASLIAVGNRVFLTSDSGQVFVYEVGDDLELIQINQFEGDNGRFSGTPAVDGDQIFFRAEKKLFCVKKNS